MGLMTVYKLGYGLDGNLCLIKEKDTMYSGEITVSIGKTAYGILEQVFYPAIEAESTLYMMALDSRNKVLGLFKVSHGSMKCTLLNLQGIFTRAVICGASGIIVAHSHPGVGCEITGEDEAYCKELRKASELMGITLIDYMILGNMEYISFREKGLLGE